MSQPDISRAAIRRRLIFGIGLVLLVGIGIGLTVTQPQPNPEPRIKIVNTAEAPGVRVEVTGLSAALLNRVRGAQLTAQQWEAIVALRTGDTASADHPPVAGTYATSSDGISFTPRWPLKPGLPYVVSVNLQDIGRGPAGPSLTLHRLTHQFTLAAPSLVSSGIVAAVYPTADTVPANLLKFYVQFSVAMMQGEAANHITLFDVKGDTAADAFLRLEEEFWDPAGRRLTVFLDPGRIKRGLKPHRDLGAPLHAGARYRLHIDSAWPDTSGAPLQAGFDKWFAVTGSDRRAPSIDQWQVTVPAAGTQDPIALRSPEPVDRALAEHMIGVRDSAGALVSATATITAAERTVLLTPSRPWRAGTYRIEIDAELEDLAGNSFRRLFDVDLSDPHARPHDDLKVVTLTVRVVNNQAGRLGESVGASAPP